MDGEQAGEPGTLCIWTAEITSMHQQAQLPFSLKYTPGFHHSSGLHVPNVKIFEEMSLKSFVYIRVVSAVVELQFSLYSEY